ncbi:hypothetical protein N8H41_06080 [Pseudomonas vlassakiae]|uniref:hypothetical protein n=1 Tax=Pseudomonas vlassakiae TaxID=485888 RepID=UPI0021C6210D|nr:hypothetical protein [Pseudomonas vlassakiae]MCU0123543.1 hypothetical protein [Pseudomonas vlassakiae]
MKESGETALLYLRAKQKAEIAAPSDINRKALSSGLTRLCFLGVPTFSRTPMGASPWGGTGEIVSFGGSAATFALLAKKNLHSKKISVDGTCGGDLQVLVRLKFVAWRAIAALSISLSRILEIYQWL